MNVTKSHIMKRAWQLARWNRGCMGNSPRKEFGKWLSHAWKEAKEDRTENWTFLSAEREIKALGLALTCIENKDYCRPSDYIEAAALKARIDVIKYAGGVHA